MSGCKDHKYVFNNYCGAQVCIKCNDHKGLARCFCGWNLPPNEKLEDDIGVIKKFNGKSWDLDY